MIQDINDSRHFTADYKKVFKRKSDGIIAGTELWLGYTYYIDGALLDTPLFEEIGDYQEIDEPTGEDVILDADAPLVAEPPQDAELPLEQAEKRTGEETVAENLVKQPVTLSDYRELEKKVELLMKMIGGN